MRYWRQSNRIGASLALACVALAGCNNLERVKTETQGPSFMVAPGKPGSGTKWVLGFDTQHPSKLPLYTIFAASGLARNGNAFVAVRHYDESYCYRLDGKTGKVLWKQRIQPVGEHLAFLPTAEPLPIVILVDATETSLTGPVAVGLEDKTGRELWRSDVDAGARSFVLVGQRLFLSIVGAGKMVRRAV